MKYSILLLLWSMSFSASWAHEANEAFFKFTQTENTIEVAAEFPWTLRNALLAYKPSLKEAVNNRDFETTFLEYLRENLILKDENGVVLQLLGFEELDNNQHAHQNTYNITFKGTSLSEVTNTTLCNLNGNQVNYNTLALGKNNETFQTGNEKGTFQLKKENNTPYLLLLLIPVFYFFYKKFGKKSVSN